MKKYIIGRDVDSRKKRLGMEAYINLL